MSDSWLGRLEKKITRISSMDYDPAFFSLEQLLVMISFLYQAGSKIRLRMYGAGLLKQKTLPCFVISIGNIVVGGAGKTPMAIYLADLLTKMGKKPLVISRGYKGSLKSDAEIVGDAETIFLDADAAGDEPYMMARRKSFPVVVGKDRYAAGMLAIKQLNPDVIVLDDAFQHLKLKKDLNILLFDHECPLGNKRMLPAGRLRETPAMSKKRANAIVFTRCPEKDNPENRVNDNAGQTAFLHQKDRDFQKGLLRQYGEIPFFKTYHSPFLFQMLPRGEKRVAGPGHPDSLTGRRGLLFSGIASNQSFRDAAQELGVNVVDHLEFTDHYRYKKDDILLIQKRTRETGADLIITTEKDWVKLDSNIEWRVDLAVIGIRIIFEKAQEFETFIRSRLNGNDLSETDG